MMLEDDLHISLIAPTRDAEAAIATSRRRISASTMQLLASHDTSARAHEALRQSYRCLQKRRPCPTGLLQDD